MHAIATKQNGNTLFISASSKRSLDGKYLVEYTKDKTEAQRFTRSEAETLLPLIHNPYNRSFSIVTASAKHKKVVSAVEDFS